MSTNSNLFGFSIVVMVGSGFGIAVALGAPISDSVPWAILFGTGLSTAISAWRNTGERER